MNSLVTRLSERRRKEGFLRTAPFEDLDKQAELLVVEGSQSRDVAGLGIDVREVLKEVACKG